MHQQHICKPPLIYQGLFFALLGTDSNEHHATKKTKPRLFDDIVADQDLWLPGLEYFFG
jgi:hypothetical protein